MDFVPAGELIGDRHQVRSVRIAQSPDLPDGEYAFIDMYCSDPDCDCRKTMIQVLHNNKHVATINYGWESERYYQDWMRGDVTAGGIFPAMHGASMDLTSPNLVSEKGLLGLFNLLLNDIWIAKFKTHYRDVKRMVSRKASGKRKGLR